jgi:alpha-tubulin suppressor-like RCC1 family protein
VPTVAVGHFRDYTRRGAELSQPLTDMLATNLARAPGLQVVSTARMLELMAHDGANRDTSAATSDNISATVKRVVVIKYRSLSVGSMHACDLASGGIAWCWGLNGREGRIGITTLGDAVQSSVPVRVPGGLRFTQLATFGRHSCAITAEGKAYRWGYNGSNVLGVTGMNQSATPMAVTGNIVFKQITTGSEHTCGLSIDGLAYCWGLNSSGELGDGTKVAKASPTLVTGGLTFTSIVAGSGATCAVATDRALYCWGSNVLGQLGDGQPIAYGGGASSTVPKRVVGGLAAAQAGAGLQYACAVTTSNQAMCWGSNNGKFGNGNSTDSSIPQAVMGGLVARSISTGYAHSCLVTMTSEVWCWGDNHHGELGNAVGSGSNKPVRAGGSLLAADVSAAGIGTGSGANTCSVSADRLTVTCWGENDVGQLGNGATDAVGTSTTTPAIVVGQKPLPLQ